MDLKEIRDELRKLSELIGGWSDLESAAALEKDWALEKLRAIYEVVRFGAGQAVGTPDVTAAEPAAVPVVEEKAESVPQPAVVESETPHAVENMATDAPMAESAGTDELVVVDLGEVLSLETEDTVESAGGSPTEEPVRTVAEPNPVPPAVEPAVGSSEVVGSQEVSRPAFEVFELTDETEKESESLEHAAPEPRNIGATAAVETEAVASRVPAEASGADPEFLSETGPIPEESPMLEESSMPENPEPAASEQEPAAPTLFGLDDKMERHRHKQRVIMSLYDTAPAETEPFAAASSRPDGSDAHRHAAAAGRAKSAIAGADPEIVLLDAYTEEPVEESRPVHAADPAAPTQAAEYFVPDGDAGPEEEPAPEMLEPQSAHIEVLQDDLAVPAGAVLGEVINHDVQTLADTIVSPGFGRYGEPISDLRQAIGINDKFSMIRDLFGGDSDLFETTIAALNAQPGLDDCMIYIAERFAWNPDSESAKLMMELLERKFA